MAWGSGPNTSPLNGTISLEGIPNLPGYRSTPCRPQKHRQTLQIRHGSMVVIGIETFTQFSGFHSKTRRASRAAPTRGRRDPLETSQDATAHRAAKKTRRSKARAAGCPSPKINHSKWPDGKEQYVQGALGRPTSVPSLHATRVHRTTPGVVSFPILMQSARPTEAVPGSDRV